ncbi:MAG: sensor histidine kinase [Burkholderiaceae bacterium]
MRLSDFIRRDMELVLVEWEAVARTMIPPSETMSSLELRNHAELMLLAIAADIETAQTDHERDAKSKGRAAPAGADQTSAAGHGALRHLSGFDPKQLGGEFRALRATVLRFWRQAHPEPVDAAGLEDLHRFNEGIDQAMAESLASYSDDVASSRDTFIAIFGHDLRSPLAAIRNCLAILNSSQSQKPQRERAFEIASSSASLMEAMIADLLEYTRAKLGKGVEIFPRPGDFSALCHEAVEEVKAANPARGLASNIGAGLLASFDHDRMLRVLSNLLTNAVKYGAANAPVELGVEAQEDEIVVVVRNWGVPIPADKMQVIFNPLVQLVSAESAPHDRPSTSMGLGLFIVREIVSAHGGSIAVASSAEEGTAFTLRIPRAPALPRRDGAESGPTRPTPATRPGTAAT